MVKKRVAKKAMVFGQEVTVGNYSSENYKVDPSIVSHLYSEWVMPLTKLVEVEYLLCRLDWKNTFCSSAIISDHLWIWKSILLISNQFWPLMSLSILGKNKGIRHPSHAKAKMPLLDIEKHAPTCMCIGISVHVLCLIDYIRFRDKTIIWLYYDIQFFTIRRQCSLEDLATNLILIWVGHN